jgi:outer membrane protein TolC
MAAFTGLKAARAGRGYYQLSTKQSEEEVISQVAQAYYNILASRETIRLQDSNIQNLQKLVTASEGQYKNGLARKIDLDRIKVSLINAQSQRNQALNQVAVQTNQLKVLLGTPLETELTLADIRFDEVEQHAARTLSADPFDVTNKTEVKLLDSQITLSQLQRKSIQAENYPRLSAYFNYSQNVMSNNLSNVFTGSGDAINYGVGSFGVRLSVPVFDGLARYSRARQSDVQIHQLQKRREATLLSANASFLNARMQMSNSLETLRAQHENVKLAGDVYAASQSNYGLGLTSLTDLLDAQNSYTEAQNIYTRELLNFKLAELETLRSTGNTQKLLEQ